MILHRAGKYKLALPLKKSKAGGGGATSLQKKQPKKERPLRKSRSPSLSNLSDLPSEKQYRHGDTDDDDEVLESTRRRRNRRRRRTRRGRSNYYNVFGEEFEDDQADLPDENYTYRSRSRSVLGNIAFLSFWLKIEVFLFRCTYSVTNLVFLKMYNLFCA